MFETAQTSFDLIRDGETNAADSCMHRQKRVGHIYAKRRGTMACQSRKIFPIAPIVLRCLRRGPRQHLAERRGFPSAIEWVFGQFGARKGRRGQAAEKAGDSARFA